MLQELIEPKRVTIRKIDWNKKLGRLVFNSMTSLRSPIFAGVWPVSQLQTGPLAGKRGIVHRTQSGTAFICNAKSLFSSNARKRMEILSVGAEEEKRARFAKLITPFLSHGFRLARSLTGNRTDAEDVLQEACLRAFRGIDSVVDTNARAWLLTIVHHTACTWLRKNRPAALIAVPDVAAVEAKQAKSNEQDANTPETALIAKADRARLEAAIGSLSLPYRETFTLREVEGLNYREIAEITGRSHRYCHVTTFARTRPAKRHDRKK